MQVTVLFIISILSFSLSLGLGLYYTYKRLEWWLEDRALDDIERWNNTRDK